MLQQHTQASTNTLYTPHRQWPEAGPWVRYRGQTGRCPLSLSGGHSGTPESDTEPHKSPPCCHHWLQASCVTTTPYNRLPVGTLWQRDGLPQVTQARWAAARTGHVAPPQGFHMQGQRWAGLEVQFMPDRQEVPFQWSTHIFIWCQVKQRGSHS